MTVPQPEPPDPSDDPTETPTADTASTRPCVPTRTIAHTDGDFSIGWDSVVERQGSRGDVTLVSAARQSSGGAPGAQYEVIVRLEPTEKEDALITVAHYLRNTYIDPLRTRICSIRASLEEVDAFGTWGTSLAVLVEQDGTLYGTTGGSGYLPEEGFTKLAGDGPERPDFSGGDWIRIGFHTRVYAQAGSEDRVRVIAGYDNFEFELLVE